MFVLCEAVKLCGVDSPHPKGLSCCEHESVTVLHCVFVYAESQHVKSLYEKKNLSVVYTGGV